MPAPEDYLVNGIECVLSFEISSYVYEVGILAVSEVLSLL